MTTAQQAIERFKNNEARINDFVNSLGTYATENGTLVETLRSFLQRIESEANSVVGSLAEQRFVANTGFTPGTTNRLTLTVAPYSAAHILVFFDGAYKNLSNYSIQGNDIVFTAAIPVGVNTVQVIQNRPVSIGAPSDATVDDAKIKPGSGLYNRLKATVYADDYAGSIIAAIAALPAEGGVVQLGIKRYPPIGKSYNNGYISKANVLIRGAKMPYFSANGDRLEGGSVIEGRFNVFADNFGVENVGFDLGKYVVDTYYGGTDTHSANHPDGGTWDAFAFAQPVQTPNAPMRRNFYAKNVIGLLKDSYSYGHGVLMEGFDGGYVDNVIGMGGIHGLVIKASNVAVGYIAGYGASTDDVILKSDDYARGGNINIDFVETGKTPSNVTPWSAPAQSSFGLLINPATSNMGQIKIGKARLSGAYNLFAVQGPADKIMDNLSIGELECEGYGNANVVGINMTGPMFYRCKLGLVNINNVADGIAYQQSQAAGGFAADPLFIDSVSFGGSVTTRAIQLLGFGRLVANQVRTTAATNIMYAIDDTARIHVGREELSGNITTKFQFSPPTLSAGWQQYPNNQLFRVKLINYGVSIEGLLQPVNGGSVNICSLPKYLRPATSARFSIVSKAQDASYKLAMAVSSPDSANLQLNEGLSVAGTEQYLSLQGVTYDLD